MDTPTNLTAEFDYVAKATDQTKALDEACEWAIAQGWSLISIILKEGDVEGKIEGKHVFTVLYNKPQ
jgi:hypothetical protein